MAREHHTQVTPEEIAQAFEEDAGPADLSPFSVEDWITLAVFWAILPWLVPLFVALIVITFVPQVTLWLPTQMGLIR